MPVGEAGEQSFVSGKQARRGFGDDALGEIKAAGGIQGNHKHAAQDAAEERGNPLRAVLSPEHDAVTSDDLAAHQLGGKALGEVGKIGVGGDCRRLPRWTTTALWVP